MNENCYEAVYSEDYADYIVEYNGDRQVLEEIYSTGGRKIFRKQLM